MFCWSDISGYMAACWRALGALPGIELKVLAYQVGAGNPDISFARDVLSGLDIRLLDTPETRDAALIAKLVVDYRPDVVVTAGWINPAYSALSAHPQLRGVKFFTTVDSPWRGGVRQRLARFKLAAFLGRMSGVAVAGERAWQYARHLGFSEDRILRGMYGFDAASLEGVHERRCARPWPRRFLFMGRYVQGKGIDVLLEGYLRYRRGVDDPWPMTFCGQGPYRERIAGAEGAQEIGFIQPAALPDLLLQHGVYVAVSRFEPWGVAIAEAMAAGLPVICSEACGASVDLVRHLYSGLLVPTAHPERLAGALAWMHEHVDLLPEMGRRARELAAPFAAQWWARRWLEMLERL